jgi:HK97 family phage major capsid protein
MEKDVAGLTADIQRLEAAQATENSLAQATTAPVLDAVGSQGAGGGSVRASEEYRRDFLNYVRGRGVQNLQQESVDEDGGYLVPTTLESQIIRNLTEAGAVRGAATVLPIAGPVPTTMPSADWVPEGAPITESSAKFGAKILSANRLAVLIKVTKQLAADNGVALEQYLTEAASEALLEKEEEAFCIGDGNLKPAGIFTTASGAGIKVGAATISGDDLMNLVYELKCPYRAGASFLLNDSTLLDARKLKTSDGQYLWQPALQAGEPDRLLGYPVLTSAFAPQVSAGALAVAFGDLKSYWIGDREGISVQILLELYAASGIIFDKRSDGVLVRTEGVKLLQTGTGA